MASVEVDDYTIDRLREVFGRSEAHDRKWTNEELVQKALGLSLVAVNGRYQDHRGLTVVELKADPDKEPEPVILG